MRRHGLFVAVFLIRLLHPVAVGQPVPCLGGVAGPYTCHNVDLLAHLPLNAGPGFNESSSDVWGWTDPVTGTEYALVLQYDHTAFVDLSEPTAPVVVGTLPVEGLTAVARDAKVYADHAFIGTDAPDNPLQVFNLRRLRDVPPEAMPVPFTADALYPAGADPHNLSIDTARGFAYLVYVGPQGTCTDGLHIADVRDPLHPQFVGCFDALGDFHDVQCLTYAGPDADYQGRGLCFAARPGGNTLAIIDVTDPAEPQLISETPYPDGAYAHQGWLTDDGRYFLLDDEFDESNFGHTTRTIVFDVSDLDEPDVAFEHFGTATSTDHNLFVRGRYVYQANYTSGLRILDLAGIDDRHLTEVAFFDTHPENDATGFDGAFGVYPFFESGIVVVSDMARGLFVLQPRLDGEVAVEPAGPESALPTLSIYPNPAADRITVTVTLSQPATVTAALYDLLGRRVALLHEGPLPSGETRLPLDAAGLHAGIYVVRIAGETGSVAQPVVLGR